MIASRLKQIVIDVDTQRRFFLDGRAIRVRNHRSVLANIRRVIAWTRLRHIHILSTVQTCAANAPCRTFCAASHESLKKISYTLRNKRTSFDATDCTDLPAGIFRQYDQVILHKRCLDPFEEPRADRILTELQANRFMLIGALTEGAVKATALGLLARGKNVTVLVDAIGSCNKAAAKIALRQIRAKGAKLTYTRALLGPSRRIMRLAYKKPNHLPPQIINYH
jgi:nicotinamidase-related amidase